MDRNTLLELIPAYALGALDPDERAEVEAFLAADAEGRALLADYQGLSDALVLTTPARRAPAHLNADLRARLAANRPQPAVTAAPKPGSEPRLATPPTRPVLQRRSRGWVPYLAAAAMIALVLAAVLLLRGQPSVPPDDPAQRYEWIIAQQDIRRIPITPSDPTPTTQGELVLTANGEYAVIEVWELPPIQADQTFQLWLIDDQGARSGGLLEFPEAEGPNYINLPLAKPADDYTAFGVSIEPAGGSPDPNGPTGPRVFGVVVQA